MVGGELRMQQPIIDTSEYYMVQCAGETQLYMQEESHPKIQT